MTKARDLANASTALSAVSATELAFVDGVTSAIQTQMDAKAPSSTAVTLTGTQTLTNKTLTSPVIASVINNTLTSTTGDIIYASGANTPARLGIGSSAQVLTVASGIPSWATPTVAGFVGARVYKSTSQAFTTATFTEVSWDLEVFDTDGFHDNVTNNNRFTIPAGKAGYYRIEYQLQPYNTTENYWKAMKNGSAVHLGDYAQVGGTTGQVWFSYVASFAVADYISFQYAQYTGVNKNVQATGGSYAQIQYLGA